MKSDGMHAIVEDWKSSLAVPGQANEWESKQLIEKIGIRVPKGIFLEAGDLELIDAGEPSGFSFPCVVKVCSGDILHKTERGGVLLNVSANELPEAVQQIRKNFPNAGILVEEMLQSNSTEIIIGALHDPSFGPAVMVGAGGILTELYKDVSFRLAPCSKREAFRMIRELIIAPALEGYRGLTNTIDALAGTIERVADLSLHLIDEGCQLDMNPIVWSGKQWVALDVKIMI